ncbi:sugar ABC transporter ATP-binding protein [Mesorhizobium sp. CA13]|uniref:sugar ABC transporter ATP-binding protein n=2 Tax=Mesorhizobium TaxID=68287 RepID=UPI001CCA09DB|nr:MULTISPECIES: sugar ABC transporter ATP-binding protein [unclassified Mesorhizobium]MBZ9856472.1 sugar ABC transporter ATP-binding protein [Mesorhizobium sp. CA13]MBZ9965781.1 sugar ABC transporter ATP-binding protein [Mesorhizobium sp. BR1-1-2]MCA0011898.1 sugar ABC transporter ATP-binding protein [Mesorhizobium sp. B294B1A1]MCA0038152.1 sugar ABC transporter ATP-binding protein [Mesorhizobium sp. B292B1B]
MAPPFLVVRNISKAFGGAQALRGASLDVVAGEVHGLVGANGAGKSTMIRILAGLNHPDKGSIEIDGQTVGIETAHRATEFGMSFIHQELAFVPGMTVLQNIMLGVPKRSRFGLTDWAAVARDVEPIARRVGITAPLNANVKGLSTAENWLINICRALVRKSRLIVMDEPTASLSAAESEKLFLIIKDLSASGVAVLYVSHRLDEILKLCDRVSVLRDGDSVAEFTRAGLDRRTLVEAIVGADHASSDSGPGYSPQNHDIVLRVQNLARLPKVRGVSFELRQGEVLGIGGLVGAGRSELVRLIYGADRADSGSMTLRGKPYAPKSPEAAVAAGLGLVPEERRTEGLFLSKSVAFNLGLVNLDKLVLGRGVPLLSRKSQSSLARETMKLLSIKTASMDTPVGRLSGGNQQKVVIGRWLRRAPHILILDEPTRGVDIGARAEIHRQIRELAAAGMAVLVVSSEPDELPELCDRVLVMAEGLVVRELSGASMSRSAIIEASYGGREPSTEGMIT